MNEPPVFSNRTHAGRLLAQALTQHARREDVIVLGLPRGGVPVACEVALQLHAPLDVLVVRKLGVPGYEELAMGAIASGGVQVTNEPVMRAAGIPRAAFEAEAALQWQELRRRELAYRGHAGAPEITGRTVILIDDGIATGSTLIAAVKALRQQQPRQIIVAVPVAAPDSCAELEPLVDELVTLIRPAEFRGVGQWYEDFSQTTDAEVTQCLGHRSLKPPARRQARAMSAALVAYFTMEIALDAAMPTYAGGLGVLAGDMLRAAAELKVPMVAVTLLHRKGYFCQHIDASGWQRETACDWDIPRHLAEQPQRVAVVIESRTVYLRAWKYEVTAPGGFCVPVFFLDTDLPENSEWDRTLTHYLYGGEAYYRICQEVVLGIGGVRMLHALGFDSLARYHMNEGHAALLGLELLDEAARRDGRTAFTLADVETVRRQCVFTTHTPVAAGHDQFPLELAMRVLGRAEVLAMKEVFCCEGMLNMTFLALNLSHFINGVAKKHAETSQLMFAHYKIHSITNGVHAATWTSPPFQELFDRHITGWREDNFSLRFAHNLPLPEIRAAHGVAKRQLFERVKQDTGTTLDPDLLTLGFARRATAYKRSDLLVSDVNRLQRIATGAGPLQILYGGKAHPNDQQGKETIQHIIQVRDRLPPQIKLVYLENYDTDLAKLLVAGVDVWLNTPQPPLEASGTSGMKAALNGVPSLSILDGWWYEGWIEGETGWAIGEACTVEHGHPDRAACDAAALYDKLEHVVTPLFYQNRDRFSDIMRHSISLNGSFFNTQRMVSQYVIKAYFE